MKTKIKRSLVLLMIMLLVFTGCANKKNAEAETKAETETKVETETNAETETEAETEAQEDKVIYEAFFLDNEEILDLFAQVRGEEAPYENVTKDFHVTTAFMPEKDMHEFYGTEVTVKIYAYQDGEVKRDEGDMTRNEGFFCTIETEDEKLQDYIDHMEKNWHITGSYMHAGGAKYTEYVDLTDAMSVDFEVKGHFGGSMASGNIVFTPEM